MFNWYRNNFFRLMERWWFTLKRPVQIARNCYLVPVFWYKFLPLDRRSGDDYRVYYQLAPQVSRHLNPSSNQSLDHESMCLTFYAWLAPIGKKVLLNNGFYVVCFGCRFYQSQAVSEQLHFLTTILQNSISSFQNFYLYRFCF